jgi:Leucine-rich repeat (LRR) protein
MNLPGDVTGQHITTLFLERAGLLRESVVGQVDFAHRTLQEYLAARAAVNADDIETLLHHAANDQWRETIIAAAGLANEPQCEALLNGLLEQAAAQDEDPNEPRTVGLLAVACLETAELVPPELRAAIIAQARSYIPPKNDEEAKQLAKAGDPIVPLLAHQPAHSPREAANCVRALAQIGTTAAMEMLVGYTACEYEGEYGEQQKDMVRGALGEAWTYFDRQSYVQCVLARMHKLSGCPHFKMPPSGRETIPIICWQEISTLTHLEELHIKLPDDITDLTPLTAFVKLLTLSIHGRKVRDISPLTNFSALRSLFLIETEVSDLNQLLGLPNLLSLDLREMEISNLTPLAGLTSLRTLSLYNTPVHDLTPLAGLTSLHTLALNSTDVTDLTPLAGLASLRILWLNGTSVHDLTPLADLTNLQGLWLAGSSVHDLSPLADLTYLTNLILNKTAVTDLTPLEGLTSLRGLYLGKTAVSDLSPLANLSSLHTVYLEDSAVPDLTPLAGLTNLRELHLDNTAVSDLTPLAGLTNLRELRLSGTEADTTPLEHLEQLEIHR